MIISLVKKNLLALRNLWSSGICRKQQHDKSPRGVQTAVVVEADDDRDWWVDEADEMMNLQKTGQWYRRGGAQQQYEETETERNRDRERKRQQENYRLMMKVWH